MKARSPFQKDDHIQSTTSLSRMRYFEDLGNAKTCSQARPSGEIRGYLRTAHYFSQTRDRDHEHSTALIYGWYLLTSSHVDEPSLLFPLPHSLLLLIPDLLIHVLFACHLSHSLTHEPQCSKVETYLVLLRLQRSS